MNGPQSLSIDVLAQRLSNTDAAVTNLQNQFSNGFAKLESQIALVGERMSAAQTAALTAQRPQWQLIATFVVTMIAVVGAAWGLGTRPINADIARQSENIAKLESSIGKVAEGVATLPQTYLSRQEYADNRLQARQDNENRFRAVDTEISSVEADLKEVSQSIVPRGEHEEHWTAQAAAIEAARQERLVQIGSLQQQISEVKESLGGIYGARDVIRDLQARMDRIDEQRTQ